jgi:serine/threonine protein kinase
MTDNNNLWSTEDELQPLTMVGTTIADRYELEKHLGQGGMSSVYRATDKLLGRQVAIKIMKAGLISRKNPRRFYREAKSLARMNHPNIVTLYNCGWHAEQAFLVMEYVPGIPLNFILSSFDNLEDIKSDLTIDKALNIAIKVTEALSYAHRQGVIHRDIKPGNIIVGNEIKLMDFGIAKMRQDPLTTSSVGLGTPLYMAPEQTLGHDTDERTDIYSLGVVFYEMFTGRPPFSASDDVPLISQHMQTIPVMPNLRNPAVPARLNSLILTMLAKNPDKRPLSADEVLIELEASQQELKDKDRANIEIPLRIGASPIDHRKIEILRGIPLFTSISINDLVELSNKLRIRHYKKGQVIFHKDDFGSTIHMIMKGKVRVSVPSDDGQDLTLAYLGNEDFFGELSLLDEKPRSATITAVEHTDTLALERDDFIEFLRWYPQATIRVFCTLAQRLRDLNYYVQSILSSNPAARLAKILLNLMTTHGNKKTGGFEIEIPLTISELSKMSGIPSSRVKQLLQTFTTTNVINVQNRRYVICKPERLQELAG